MQLISTVFLFVFISSISFGQLAGIKTIPGDFPSISAAISALDTQGVGNGGVTFNVSSGYTEIFNSVSDGVISATGTEENRIIFQKSGTGNNPVITAATGISQTLDGIITITGGDYITFDGIDLKENPLNIDLVKQMEWGYGLLKTSASSPFNGCNNVKITNCTITLDNTSYRSAGIYSGTHTLSSKTILNLTSAEDLMQNCTFSNNKIADAYSGITLNGPENNNIYLYDHDNVIQGNSITGFGNKYNDRSAGVFVSAQNRINIDSNIIKNETFQTETLSQLFGIYIYKAAHAYAYITGNTISLMRDSLQGNLYGIQSSADYTFIKRNTFNNFHIKGAMYTKLIFCFPLKRIEIDSNYIGDFTLSAGPDVYVIDIWPAEVTMIRNNIISNISHTKGISKLYAVNISGIGSGTGTINNNEISNISNFNWIYGIKVTLTTLQILSNKVFNLTGIDRTEGINGSAATIKVNNNIIHDLTSTGTIGVMSGICFSGSGECTSNRVYNLSSNGEYNKAGGITAACTTAVISKNLVYGIKNINSEGMAAGILLYPYGTLHVYNNFISDIKATAGSGNAVDGIFIDHSGTVYLTYNSIYLDASSTTSSSFSVYNVYCINSDARLVLRNNILVNKSVPGPQYGYVAALGTNYSSLLPYDLLSDGNCFYVTPGERRGIYKNGETLDTSITEFKNRVAPREQHSVYADAPFKNVTSSPYDLHLDTLSASPCFNGGVSIVQPFVIPTDIDDDVRSAMTPDIGADETFSLAQLNDNVILPTEYMLMQNYPNPFNPATLIKYSVASAGNVKISVYDILGKKISDILNEHKSAGSYEVSFDGSSLPSGVYFYRIETGSFTETKKMVLLR